MEEVNGTLAFPAKGSHRHNDRRPLLIATLFAITLIVVSLIVATVGVPCRPSGATRASQLESNVPKSLVADKFDGPDHEKIMLHAVVGARHHQRSRQAKPACAVEGEKALACGARKRRRRADACCGGLTCHRKRPKCVALSSTSPVSKVEIDKGTVQSTADSPLGLTAVPEKVEREKLTAHTTGAPPSGSMASPSDPFVFSGTLDRIPSLGLSVASGLAVRVLARSGKSVPFTSENATVSNSRGCRFHVRPDGAATFDAGHKDEYGRNVGEWYYCSNAEVKEFQRSKRNRCNGGLIDGKCRAGVYCLLLDRHGEVKDYVHRLGGDDKCGANDGVGPDLPATSTNCQGGVTPWNTWVSCEETAGGYCWQVDPTGRRMPQKIEAIGSATTPGIDGKGWEAMAVDSTDESCPTFYFTEDRHDGMIRRLRPDCQTQYPGWDLLHKGNIVVDFLAFVSGCGGTGEEGVSPKHTSGTFRWTSNVKMAQETAKLCFPYCEGITVAKTNTGPSKVYFVTKNLDIMYSLQHNGSPGTATGGTWRSEVTHNDKLLEGEGSFDKFPDQITTEVTAQGDFVFHTTDGSATPGVYVHNMQSKKYFTLWQSDNVGWGEEESVGHALSPDGRFIVGALQKDGRVFIFSRESGGKIEGFDFALRRRHRGF